MTTPAANTPPPPPYLGSTLAVPDFSSDLWVFGYGSLMWQPGFTFEEVCPALLSGWRRSLCIYSWHYRGTEAQPGLVLGLDSGGSCRGMAYRVTAALAEKTVAYLRERELVSYVYRELLRPVRLSDGRRVPALTYAADPRHDQYAGALSLEQRAALVSKASGIAGANRDYVVNTLTHLEALGVHDPELAFIVAHP